MVWVWNVNHRFMFKPSPKTSGGNVLEGCRNLRRWSTAGKSRPLGADLGVWEPGRTACLLCLLMGDNVTRHLTLLLLCLPAMRGYILSTQNKPFSPLTYFLSCIWLQQWEKSTNKVSIPLQLRDKSTEVWRDWGFKPRIRDLAHSIPFGCLSMPLFFE